MLVALILAVVLPLHASVIGTSKPAESITATRIAALSPTQRAAWLAYLKRSEKQRTLDQQALATERGHLAGPPPPLPKEGNSARSMPMHRELAFYVSSEARHIADTILSFQLPSGGWSKNLDLSGPPRLPGQAYMPDNLSRHPGQADFDQPADPAWNYAGTLDNDATTTELHFLSLVAARLPKPDAAPYRAAFVRGVVYLLGAQFPNGGWPQVWPLEGGYHDAITFNDNAVTNAATLLGQVAHNSNGEYSFVAAPLRSRAAAAAARAVGCILATQVVLAGGHTVWPQQADALTLAPVAGRNFEPAALSAGESANLLLFLMELPHPDPAVIAAVATGAAWLRSHEISGAAWGRGSIDAGRQLTPSAGAPPLWPRYISLETGKPIFGDRDKTIHDTVEELSLERRNGYAWYGSGPQAALDAYAAWSFRR